MPKDYKGANKMAAYLTLLGTRDSQVNTITLRPSQFCQINRFVFPELVNDWPSQIGVPCGTVTRNQS